MNISLKDNGQIAKTPTGVEGLDQVGHGGLPSGRSTIVCGTSGSAKTVFAAQFLAKGIEENKPGVFVTFEETPTDIRKNMHGFNWDIDDWEKNGLWTFVDGSSVAQEELIEAGGYDLGALLARIEHAVKQVNAKQIVIDSLGAIFGRFRDQSIIRREIFRIISALKIMDLTAVITAERIDEYGEISRNNVEEFVADNVIVLRNVLEEEKRRRTIEILKFRGATHQSGEWPFTILSGEGLVVLPLSAIELKQSSSDIRISSGIDKLDEMCGGGFFRDSIVLVSGATGAGKTLMTTHFIRGGTNRKERCLLFAFEESRQQLIRNARGWNVDYDGMEKDGVLQVECMYPEVASLEDHLIRIKKVIEEFKPNRVAVDSVSALERVGTNRGFREFIIGLTSFIKHQEIAGLFTATTPTLTGGESVTESHFSTITDSIILLRYVEIFGEMKRGLAVLKMRGSMHDKNIRSYEIDGTGMHIGEPFSNVNGILSGNFSHIMPSDEQRIKEIYKDLT